MHVGEAPLWYRYWLDRSSVLWAGLATCTELAVTAPSAAISRRVARMPAWASSWIALKMSRRSATGMRGLGCPVEVSQMTLSPCMSTCCSCNEEEWAAFNVSWHVLWFAAILA